MNPGQLFPYLKLLHVTTVAITGSLFLLRFVWMLQGTLRQRGSWVRTLPHYNDTLLLISGLAMASILGVMPFRSPWLTSKLFVLLAYILLGSLTLRQGFRPWIRATTGMAAICCYLYIVSVALCRNPTPSFEALILRLGIA